MHIPFEHQKLPEDHKLLEQLQWIEFPINDFYKYDWFYFSSFQLIQKFYLRPSTMKSDPDKESFPTVRPPYPAVTMPAIKSKTPKMRTPVSKLKQQQFSTRIFPIFCLFSAKYTRNTWNKENRSKNLKEFQQTLNTTEDVNNNTDALMHAKSSTEQTQMNSFRYVLYVLESYDAISEETTLRLWW